MKQLRDFQDQGVEAAYKHLYTRGLGGTVIHYATGLGKTVTAAEFINRYYDLHKKRVMFVVHTIDLVLQTYYAFLELHPEWEQRCYTKFGYPGIGIVMGSYNQMNSRIIIGTPQTLSGTENSSQRLEDVLKYGAFDLIIIDEAHYGPSPSYLNLCEALLPAKRLGLTATPMRSDGLALRQPIGKTGQNLFDTICISRNIKWGISNGYLSPILPPLLIETNVELPSGKGSYEERAKLIDVNNWTELVVDAWEQHGENRLSAYYLPSVEHSKKVCEEFRNRGVASCHIDGDMLIDHHGEEYTGQKSKDLRRTMYQLAEQGEIKVFCNYNVLTHGWDLPRLSCIGLARPTDSPVLTSQIIGRGTRLHKDKKDLLILDYALKGVSLILSGNLLGYTWDEKNKEMVEDEEVEIETLSDGVDLRDLRSNETLVDGNGIVIRIGSLFRKLNEAWYNGDESITLSLSENDMLLIMLPNYTVANHVSEGLETGKTYLEREPDNEKYKTFYKGLLEAHKLTSEYTLWHVKKDGYNWSSEWVASGDSAELVFDYALPLIDEFEDVRLSKKKRIWRKEEPSDAQLKMLKRFGIMDRVDRGTASQMIGHHIAQENVKKYYNNTLGKADRYGMV